jgi:hypothetical protein
VPFARTDTSTEVSPVISMGEVSATSWCALLDFMTVPGGYLLARPFATRASCSIAASRSPSIDTPHAAWSSLSKPLRTDTAPRKSSDAIRSCNRERQILVSLTSHWMRRAW